jgi:hypothetical protein
MECKVCHNINPIYRSDCQQCNSALELQHLNQLPVKADSALATRPLVCPHCQHSFALTWKRYFQSPMANYSCPCCHKSSSLSKLSWQLPFYTLLNFILILPFFFFFIMTAEVLVIFIGFVVIFIIGLPLDKHIDQNYRQLVISEKKNLF